MSTTAPQNPIRAARLKRGWSQDDLGRRVGVGKAAVSKWESGLSAPRPKQARLLSSVLRVPLQAIYSEKAA